MSQLLKALQKHMEPPKEQGIKGAVYEIYKKSPSFYFLNREKVIALSFVFTLFLVACGLFFGWVSMDTNPGPEEIEPQLMSVGAGHEDPSEIIPSRLEEGLAENFSQGSLSSSSSENLPSPSFLEPIDNISTGEEVEERVQESKPFEIVVMKKRLPESYESDVQRAQKLVKEGRIEEAFRVYEMMLKKSPSNVDVLFNHAAFLQGQGQVDKAIELYKKILSMDPSYEKAITNLVALMSAKPFMQEKLLGFLDEIYEKSQVPSLILAQKAFLYHKKGEMDLAVSHMKKAISWEPRNSLYYYNLAIYYDLLGQFKEAALNYRESLKWGLSEGSEMKVRQRLSVLEKGGA